jgi:hypothetical protein
LYNNGTYGLVQVAIAAEVVDKPEAATLRIIIVNASIHSKDRLFRSEIKEHVRINWAVTPLL